VRISRRAAAREILNPAPARSRFEARRRPERGRCAAAAAALKNLGDLSALGPLRAHHRQVGSRPPQVSSAIKSLEEEATSAQDQSPGSRSDHEERLWHQVLENEFELADSSRRKLNALPGVRVLALADEGQDKPGTLPMVMVTGKISELKASRKGSSIVYSASVEYVLHTCPSSRCRQSIGPRERHGERAEANDQTKKRRASP